MEQTNWLDYLVCPKCGKSFLPSESEVSEDIAHDTGYWDTKCPYCGQLFSYIAKLKFNSRPIEG